MRIKFFERKPKDHAAIACRASVLVEDPDLDGLVVEDVVIWFPKDGDDHPGVSFPSREYTNREGEKRRFEFVRAKDDVSIRRIKETIGGHAARWLSQNGGGRPEERKPEPQYNRKPEQRRSYWAEKDDRNAEQPVFRDERSDRAPF